MKIVKRDGHIVDYDPEKIRVAIGKANEEVRGREKATKEEISMHISIGKIVCKLLINVEALSSFLL